MDLKIAPDVVSVIIKSTAYCSEGVTLSEIVAAFPEPVSRKRVAAWVESLVEAGLLGVLKEKVPFRYFATQAAAAYLNGRATQGGSSSAGPTEGRGQRTTEASGLGRAPDSAPRLAETDAGSEPRDSRSGEPGRQMADGGRQPDPPMAQVAAGVPPAEPPSDVSGLPSGSSVPPSDVSHPSSGSNLEPSNLQPGTVPIATPPSGSSLDPIPEFEQLFLSQLFTVITGLMAITSARVVYQRRAQKGFPGDMTKARRCLAYCLQRLDKLTVGEVVREGLEPEQYYAWRRAYDGTAPGAPAASFRHGDDADDSAPAAVIADESSADPAGPSAVRHQPSGSDGPPASGLRLPASVPLPSGSSGLLAAIRVAFPWTRTPEGKIVAGVIVAAAVAVGQRLWGYSPWTALIWPLLGLVLVRWAKGRAAAVGDKQKAEGKSGGQTTEGGRQISGFQRFSISAFQGRLAFLAAVAAVLVIGALVWFRFRQRPSIATVQAFVTSRLAPLPARVAALDVTFAAPGKVGVRLTYRAAIENTAPLYRTEATTSYLENQPGHVLAALTSVDMTLDGVGGDKVRAAVGPAPTPDPRTVILLKAAVPIGTPAVASGTLFAWRTDNGWRFTIEQETPPRFAGEPRPTEKPSFVLDDAADAAALADLVQRAVAYAAKVKEAAEDYRRQKADAGRQPNSVSRKDAQKAQEGAGGDKQKAIGVAAGDPGSGIRDARSESRDSGSGQQTMAGGSSSAGPTEDRGQRTKGSGQVRAPDSAPRLDAGVASTKPVGSNLKPETTPIRALPSDASTPTKVPTPMSESELSSALRRLPSGPGAYALIDGAWASLPRANREKVQSTPQALTMKLLALEYAEDRAAGRTPKPPKDPIANVILSGTDELPTAPAGELVLVYIGELKLPSAAVMAKYPELKTYPEIELAPVNTAAGTTRYVPLYLIAPGALAFGPGRVPATLEHPAANTILLRASHLTRGRYALACGPLYYEVTVR